MKLVSYLFLLFALFWAETNLKAAETSSASMPFFSVPSLFEPGKRLTSGVFRGHVSLLNVWASWCYACRLEHSTLMSIKERYHIPIYGVIYRDNPIAARKLLAKQGNPFVAVGVDVHSDVARNLAIFATPATFIVDKHGRILYEFIGYLSLSTFENTLLPIIKEHENK